MPARTVKGPHFAIVVGDKTIVVKHVDRKGRRVRVIMPRGVRIESTFPHERQAAESFDVNPGSTD